MGHPMTELSAERIEEIRAGAAKATPGPWIRYGVRKRLPEEEDCLWVGPDGFPIAGVPIGKEKDRPGAFRDAGFIANCDPTTIAALCDLALEGLEARKALAFYADSANHQGELIPAHNNDHGHFVLEHRVNLVRRDGGAIARAALAHKEAEA